MKYVVMIGVGLGVAYLLFPTQVAMLFLGGASKLGIGNAGAPTPVGPVVK